MRPSIPWDTWVAVSRYINSRWATSWTDEQVSALAQDVRDRCKLIAADDIRAVLQGFVSTGGVYPPTPAAVFAELQRVNERKRNQRPALPEGRGITATEAARLAGYQSFAAWVLDNKEDENANDQEGRTD